mgnify:CR=1 FL=1
MLGKAKAEAAAAALAAAAKAKVGVSTVVRASEDVIRRRRVAALTDAERAQVREVFDRADTLRRGRVDGVEVRGALHALSGKWMSDEELGVFWAELSPDGAETIGFAEFLHALGPTMFPPQSVRVVQAVALRAKEAAKPLAEQAGGRAAALAHLTTEGLVAKVLDAARKAVTADALDPDMPRPLRSAVTFVLGAVFADVEVEVREHVLGLLHGRAPPAPPPPPRRNPLARALHGLRAAILYTAKPYDLSVWRQLRSPGFWLLKAVSVFPLYGVQPAYFILTFLLIDKGDECQLVDFILTFKSSQFFSIGLIAMALGALWWVHERSSAARRGPGRAKIPGHAGGSGQAKAPGHAGGSGQAARLDSALRVPARGVFSSRTRRLTGPPDTLARMHTLAHAPRCTPPPRPWQGLFARLRPHLFRRVVGRIRLPCAGARRRGPLPARAPLHLSLIHI